MHNVVVTKRFNFSYTENIQSGILDNFTAVYNVPEHAPAVTSCKYALCFKVCFKAFSKPKGLG